MARNELVIYEGAMCCSSGVCGPEPNKALIEFNSCLKKLQKEFKELNIVRASISSDIKMFLENKDISKLVKKNGQSILPITTINGRIVAKQKYPEYEELKNSLRGEHK